MKNILRIVSLLLLLCLLLPAGTVLADKDRKADNPWAAEEEYDEDWWDKSTSVFMFLGHSRAFDSDDEHPGLYLDTVQCDTAYIGPHVQFIRLGLCSIGNFVVDERNPCLTSVDGVIFTKDMSKLVLYPSGREDAHYDVPAGTKIIGMEAFEGATELTSVSLPLGLTQLGTGAFDHTGLTGITLPVTVKRVGPYAFQACVNLASCSAPSSVSWGEYPFNNCPMMEKAEYTGDEGGVVRPVWYMEGEENDPEYGYLDHNVPFEMIADPANAEDTVYAYAAPDGKKRMQDYAWTCGEGLPRGVMAYDRVWYKLDVGTWEFDEKTEQYVFVEQYVYVRRSEVTPAPSETMFTVSRIRPAGNDVPLREVGYGLEDSEPVPFGDVVNAMMARYPEDYDEENFQCHLSGIGMCDLYYMEDGYSDEYYEFFLKDTHVTRVYTGDSRTFGMVMASRPENRVNLRAEPSSSGKQKGRYFTGTQLEVLEEKGDWYRVRIGYTEGWMMKKFVTVVEQEKPMR